ncbi:VanZ family protein [Clostridium sp. Marseille-P299]|uniref:VanZ family protein n=1 Tax=Clostridium sp. Marseille-P299 TaxID=1805477 RepID=UPI000A839B5D|nr:VanZ family protein [Clostridium sp. Marseille-P299]
MKEGKERLLHVISFILFVIYLISISYFLFFSERYGRTEFNDDYRYNLVLFQEIKRFLKYRHVIGIEGFIVNLFGNVLAFTPFGFCLPLINSRYKNFFKIVIWSFLFSLSIETIQLLYKIGIFDVDDLLLNTIGGAIGYLFLKLLTFTFRKKKK